MMFNFFTLGTLLLSFLFKNQSACGVCLPCQAPFSIKDSVQDHPHFRRQECNITITYPTAETVWYVNNTEPVRWEWDSSTCRENSTMQLYMGHGGYLRPNPIATFFVQDATGFVEVPKLTSRNDYFLLFGARRSSQFTIIQNQVPME